MILNIWNTTCKYSFEYYKKLIFALLRGKLENFKHNGTVISLVRNTVNDGKTEWNTIPENYFTLNQVEMAVL